MKKLMLLPAVFLTCLFSLAVVPASANADRLPQPCFPLFGIGCPGGHSCNEDTFLCPSQCQRNSDCAATSNCTEEGICSEPQRQQIVNIGSPCGSSQVSCGDNICDPETLKCRARQCNTNLDCELGAGCARGHCVVDLAAGAIELGHRVAREDRIEIVTLAFAPFTASSQRRVLALEGPGDECHVASAIVAGEVGDAAHL